MESIAVLTRRLRLRVSENSTCSSRQAAMTFLVPNAESPRSMIVPLRPQRAGGGDGLLDLPGGAAPGAGLAAAQPRLGDHRRRLRRGQRGDQRRQSLAQQRPSGDLGVPERGALFGVAVDRAQQRVDVQERALLDAGQQRGTRRASAARCSRATAASWLACPKVNSRSKIPSVEGAYTSSNTRGVPPARSTFTSSMLSAPHTMPAMIVVSFPAGFTAPETTRVLGRSTCSPINCERPVCSASSSTGTKPAADTRFCSSNTADPPRTYAMIAPKMPSEPGTIDDFNNRYCPSSEGIFAVHTPITQRPTPRIQA